MSTPSQPDDQATNAGAAASWPKAPQPSAPSPQYGSAQQYGSAPQQHDPAQQYGSAQQYSSAPQQHDPAQQYGSAQQYSSAPQQHDPAQQYGSAQQYGPAQQYGSAPQQHYGAMDASGTAPAAAADPVKRRATVGIILGASTVVLGLVLYVLQTVLLRVLIQNGNYEAYGVVTAAISWLSVLAMGALGVIALILGLSAAKSGQHQVRSGIAIGFGALASAGAVITLIEFLLNFALAGF
ncbi:hypothetical protein [Microbacterium nymphoidis]|uniref:hypothetical protein n=1 Tax=Microbacterium nymphoidis TaxID=2898586 RepID=UPI001E62DBE2|nr:hypothetical protein [Microbacterium nymphoidis]MCD2499989.1 hypothetical protein [Microbacterium nymphoidis]